MARLLRPVTKKEWLLIFLNQVNRGATFLHKSLRSTPELSSTTKYDLGFPMPIIMPSVAALGTPRTDASHRITSTCLRRWNGRLRWHGNKYKTIIWSRHGTHEVSDPMRIQDTASFMSLTCSGVLWEGTEMLIKFGVLQTSLPFPSLWLPLNETTVAE